MFCFIDAINTVCLNFENLIKKNKEKLWVIYYKIMQY